MESTSRTSIRDIAAWIAGVAISLAVFAACVAVGIGVSHYLLSRNSIVADLERAKAEVDAKWDARYKALPLGAQVTIGQSDITGMVIRHNANSVEVLILGTGAVAVDPAVLKLTTKNTEATNTTGATPGPEK